MVTHTGGTRTAGSTRRLNAPRPALVESHADGTPRRINRQEVATVREEWRIVDRCYFDLVLETGENVVVYRDGESGAWFTQRA